MVYSALFNVLCISPQRNTGMVKAAILGAITYFVSPIDFIPDLTPVLGFTDDLTILVSALVSISSNIDDDVRKKSIGKLKQWFTSSEIQIAVDEIDQKLQKRRQGNDVEAQQSWNNSKGYTWLVSDESKSWHCCCIPLSMYALSVIEKKYGQSLPESSLSQSRGCQTAARWPGLKSASCWGLCKLIPWAHLLTNITTKSPPIHLSLKTGSMTSSLSSMVR